jgi:hypothetical protein
MSAQSELLLKATTRAEETVWNETQQYTLEKDLEALFQETSAYYWNCRRISVCPTLSLTGQPDMEMKISIEHSLQHPERYRKDLDNLVSFDTIDIRVQIVPTEYLGGVKKLTPAMQFIVEKDNIAFTPDQQKEDIPNSTSMADTKRSIKQVRWLIQMLNNKGEIPENNPFHALIARAERELERTAPARRRGKKIKELLSAMQDIIERNAPNKSWVTTVVLPKKHNVDLEICFIDSGYIRTTYIPKEKAIAQRIKDKIGEPDVSHTYFFSEDVIMADGYNIELTGRKADKYITLFRQLIQMAQKRTIRNTNPA